MTLALPWFVCVPAVGGFPLANAAPGINRAARKNGTTLFMTCSFAWFGRLPRLLIVSPRVSSAPRACKRYVKRGGSAAECGDAHALVLTADVGEREAHETGRQPEQLE